MTSCALNSVLSAIITTTRTEITFRFLWLLLHCNLFNAKQAVGMIQFTSNQNDNESSLHRSVVLNINVLKKAGLSFLCTFKLFFLK